MVRVERDRPFPDMPPGTLNDAVLDSAIFHADLRTCGVARLSLVSIPSGIARSRKDLRVATSMWMAGPEQLAPRLQCFLIKRFRIAVAALGLIETGQVIEADKGL